MRRRGKTEALCVVRLSWLVLPIHHECLSCWLFDGCEVASFSRRDALRFKDVTLATDKAHELNQLVVSLWEIALKWLQ